ncbi:uncharacterized protein A4U43_C04F17900 [Asparagus officinalis]|uniref:Uncharacterized protein n=1 Tax=Asparagus officinalis TaxID=4686 RepID=A0A5P1F726_ASPOF|nr:uncharacterized protein A4U43_C04F17900 [Asparagus officinalis]
MQCRNLQGIESTNWHYGRGEGNSGRNRGFEPVESLFDLSFSSEHRLQSKRKQCADLAGVVYLDLVRLQH